MSARHGLAFLLLLLPASINAADMAYLLRGESSLEESSSTLDDELMNWIPMSVEAFSYDLREVWRFPKEDVWTYSVAISERLALLCDIRPHALPKPEVWTFGGLAFNR